MNQYMLSVWHVEGEEAPSEDEMQRIFKDVDTFNEKVKDIMVFGGGLHTPDTATVVRAQGGEVVMTDGPFAEARTDLCAEAIRLARLLVELMPDEPEVHGLLALLLLTEARRPARTAPDGSLVRLADQDRSRWHRQLIAEGQAVVRACLRRDLLGPYQVQAAIAAVHSDATTAADTDWDRIVRLYDLLLTALPTSVVALNRAIAVGERDGPAAALAALDGIADALDHYHLLHASRGDALERLGRPADAAAEFERAMSLTSNTAEIDLLRTRRDAAAARDASAAGSDER